ncbi:MAG: fluoride efflux transporter CrcB [Bacteroidota bacterium]|nr:fluoride efflux transporter CrcB [Bacteroidota bacterium]
MKIILAVGIGSCIGGICRYLLSIFIQNKYLSSFPFGTLSVNIIGCLLIGIVFGVSEKSLLSIEWRMFLVTGFLGGFTTFSSFSNETIGLIRDGQYWPALTYVGASVVVGLLATFIGISLIKML